MPRIHSNIEALCKVQLSKTFQDFVNDSPLNVGEQSMHFAELFSKERHLKYLASHIQSDFFYSGGDKFVAHSRKQDMLHTERRIKGDEFIYHVVMAVNTNSQMSFFQTSLMVLH